MFESQSGQLSIWNRKTLAQNEYHTYYLYIHTYIYIYNIIYNIYIYLYIYIYMYIIPYYTELELNKIHNITKYKITKLTKHILIFKRGALA